tara:strand:+ start:2982 stop:3821 length:840 start_codon:yes stop_codon:yes gene_type:complete
MADENQEPLALTPEQMVAAEGNEGKKDVEGNPVPPAPEARPPAEEPETEEPKAEEEPAAEEAPTEEPAEEPVAELDTDVWGETGNENGDAVLKMLQDAKVSPEEAKALLYDAVQEGDATKIDHAKLAEKVGDAQATLIINGAKLFITERADATQATVADIHKTVGGEDNWKQVADWGVKNIPEAEMNEYRELIDAGGAKARFAAQEMANKFNGDDANSSLTNTTVEPTSATPPATRAITRAEMVAELDKVHNSNMPFAERAKQDRMIRAARKAGQAQGI